MGHSEWDPNLESALRGAHLFATYAFVLGLAEGVTLRKPLADGAPARHQVKFPDDQYVTKKIGRDVYGMVRNGKECKNF
jgi:hypothetical protein